MGTLRIALVAALVSASAGCVTYTENLHFNADGSGSVRARLVVSESALAAASHAGSFRPERILAELSREKLEEKLNQEGIAIRRIAIERNDSARIWDVEYAFADLEAFRRVRNEGRDVALRRYDTGNYELDLTFSSGGVRPSEPSADAGEEHAISLTPADSVALTNLLTRFEATFVFEMPTRVLSAPRGGISGNTARFVWSYRRQGIDVLRPKTMRVIFRRGNLDWPTFEELPTPSDEGDAWNSSY